MSHYICPRRIWFSSYQAIDGGIILMGNKVSCNIVRVESVKIKMFNGITRTIAEVRHVHELIDLIYLEALDYGVYKFTSEGGSLKATKIENHYKLEGRYSNQ